METFPQIYFNLFLCFHRFFLCMNLLVVDRFCRLIFDIFRSSISSCYSSHRCLDFEFRPNFQWPGLTSPIFPILFVCLCVYAWIESWIRSSNRFHTIYGKLPSCRYLADKSHFLYNHFAMEEMDGLTTFRFNSFFLRVIASHMVLIFPGPGFEFLAPDQH